MIRLISAAALAAIALSATPASAQDFFAANTHVLVGEENVATVEYAWANGDLSGFGFVDKSIDSDFFITDHEVRLDVEGPVYVSAELGYNRFGGEQGKVGVGVRLSGLPVIRDNFVYLNVYAQHTVFGPDSERIIGVSWATKDLRVTDGVSVYASGFADIRHDAPDVIQPQLWLKFDDSPVEVGTEVSIFGDQASVSAAAKFNF